MLFSNFHSYSNWFVFSMFSGLGGEKAVFQPFVFSNFSGLGGCVCGGHHVSVGVAHTWPLD
jgi:hypothetical protein